MFGFSTKLLLLIFITYIIAAIISIIDSYFDFKQNLCTENYTDKLNEYKQNILLSLFPGFNIISACFFLGYIFFTCCDKLINILTKNVGKKTLTTRTELITLKEALIKNNYFKNEDEIEQFVESHLIITKLINK